MLPSNSLRARAADGGAARLIRILSVGLATGAVAAVLSSTASAAITGTLYVSPKGHNRGICTKLAPCRTISRAVHLAAPGATVSVAKGAYHEQVTIPKAIRLIGHGQPVINASGKTNGVLITGRAASGTLVKGFVVKNATFEGILALKTSDVTIANNTVENNDRGVSSAHPTGECAPSGPIPGDCGEGLHLMSVTRSAVLNNLVQNNAGGILLTDEFGPTALNLIAGNRALNNVLDCGITLAGHSTSAVSAAGVTEPSLGGVYDNVVSNNVANGDGVKGQGGGILLAAGAPGSAVYNNVVDGNTANGNGLAGVTLHSHAPGQNLNGNIITNNNVSNDGIAGGPNGTPGDADFGVTNTVGILVASAVTPLKGTEIANNTIDNVHYGIWTKNVPTISPSANTFSNVAVPVTQS
jgi:nitrous oxidase accessory protein NosD